MRKCTLAGRIESMEDGESIALARRIPIDKANKKLIMQALDTLAARLREAISRVNSTADYRVESHQFITVQRKDVMVLAIATKFGVEI